MVSSQGVESLCKGGRGFGGFLDKRMSNFLIECCGGSLAPRLSFF
jgi:hypothetical protein